MKFLKSGDLSWLKFSDQGNMLTRGSDSGIPTPMLVGILWLSLTIPPCIIQAPAPATPAPADTASATPTTGKSSGMNIDPTVAAFPTAPDTELTIGAALPTSLPAAPTAEPTILVPFLNTLPAALTGAVNGVISLPKNPFFFFFLGGSSFFFFGGWVLSVQVSGEAAPGQDCWGNRGVFYGGNGIGGIC